MEVASVERLLQTSIGLSTASIGSPAIVRAVQERLAACRMEDLDAYLARVRDSPAELQALIEAVVVPETWFFRDRHAFVSVGRFARDEWLPAHADGVVSILSLPCSTGEEPYSIAMALFDAGVHADRFRIDAVDISHRHLAECVRAVYGRNSFRGHELGFRDRYFDQTTEGYRVRENVRRQVRFRQGNLFAADLLPGVGIYDVIFCRNVLIYFDRPTQHRALGVLTRLLHPDGLLCVAPAETALPASHGLVSTDEAMAFAFRKAKPVVAAAKRKAPALTPLAPARPVAPPVAVPPVMQNVLALIGAERPVPASAPDAAAVLDDAWRLADQGHFVEAALGCEEQLRRFGPSSSAFSLMGLVRDAMGSHAEAIAFYRKALYLDPNSQDTQIHLALLLEQQGDTAAAKVLRNRARRLADKEGPSHG